MELKLTHVTKQYGTKTAVDHINMTLREGIYGLLGANGAGKTSLMRLVCLIQKEAAEKLLWMAGKSRKWGKNTEAFLDICRRISVTIRNLLHRSFYCICLP